MREPESFVNRMNIIQWLKVKICPSWRLTQILAVHIYRPADDLKYRKFKRGLGNIIFTHPFFFLNPNKSSIVEVFSQWIQNNSGKSDVSAVSWELLLGAVTQSGDILVRGLHLHYYSRWRPTSRNQEPHRGTWFNMKPPWAVLLYNDCHRNTAVSTYGDSTLNIDTVTVVSFDIQSIEIDQHSKEWAFTHHSTCFSVHLGGLFCVLAHLI